ncbi:MAG: DUF1569 domain-containing protein [Bacteroidota bacterium]
MALQNIFTQTVCNEIINRINKLTPDTQALWGKMNVSKMLAHCCVTYEMVFENFHPKPSFFMRIILRTMVKKIVVNEEPYKKNNPTAPAFIIKGDKNFEEEKTRLINYITRSQQLGEFFFENKESLSFGKLSLTEWNNMFYKHLNHHLSQFGV